MKNILLSLSLVLLSTAAHAGLLVEPHLGYDMTRVVANLTSSPGTDNGLKTNATSYGLRLGYKLPLMVWFAADVDYSAGKTAFTDTATNPTNFDYTRTDMYGVVGIDLPLFLRGWVGYGFSSNLTVKATGANTVVTGTAIKGGVGLKLIPKVSFNVEYILRSMTDQKVGSASSTKVSTTYATYKDAGALFSVSIPFNF